jgi:PBSX family phage terminase large subunit
MSLSEKQLKILQFPYTGKSALICDGSVRSGKTSIMSLSFILWAMANFNHMNFGICGKTVIATERNVIRPLLGIKYLRDNFSMRFANHILTVSRGNKANTFYVFGGKDESSYQLIQGVTLAGVLLDEVALMPESFVDQALARCSVQGSKFWFNCNPEGPQHWFYKEWILHPEEKNAEYLHFTMEDNPSLSNEIRRRYESLYSGVFYDRYIRGLWVAAEGLIYPDVANGQGIVEPEERQYVKYYISIDYGTLNPFSAGLYGLYKGVWYRFDEYYHSGRETRRQLTDAEYYEELEKLAGKRHITAIIIDPSAASMIAEIKKHGKFRVRKANNDVVDGIREVAKAFKQGKIKVTKNCSGAIQEFSEYRWDDKKQEDKPIKENDHAMDEIRYFVNTVIVHHGGTTIGGW